MIIMQKSYNGEKMRVLFNVGHPAQVHFFRNAMRILENKGHVCKMTAVDKDVSLDLLNAYGFEYDIVGRAHPTLFLKAVELLKIEKKLYRIARSFKPDILVGGSGNAYSAHVGKLIRKPSIVFEDSEKGTIEHLLTDRFATVIFTPTSYKKKIGDNQLYFNGFKELAYLHPDYFHPSQATLKDLGLTSEDKYIIFRFVTWDADHDIGHHGIKNKIKFATELEKYGRVLITSEGKLEPELEKYRVRVSPEKIHDLLYYAQMFVGDSQTMTTEAAVLGVPAIRCNSFVGKDDMSNFIELEEKYNLIFNYSDSEEALNKALELVKVPKLKEEWSKKREKLLRDKIDVTAFIVWFIENYPESIKETKAGVPFISN